MIFSNNKIKLFKIISLKIKMEIIIYSQDKGYNFHFYNHYLNLNKIKINKLPKNKTRKNHYKISHKNKFNRNLN
jgi:hypothetical protein